MSEQMENAIEATAEEQVSAAEPRTFTQEDMDKAIKARVDRLNAKYADYEDLKAKAEQVDAIKAEQTSASDKLAEMEAELAALRSEKEQREWAASAAAKFGVPASIIRGASAEEMERHAESIALEMKGAQIYSPVGSSDNPSVPNVTRESILAIKDKNERMEAIALNKHLF